MEAFRKNVLSEESADERAKSMYNMGKKDGLAGEGKDQRSHIRKDSDYTKGYSDGVAERKKKDSKKTNEAKGSAHGDGISSMTADKLVKNAVEAHNKKGGRKILPGELQKLKDWAKDNVVGDRESDAKEKINKKIRG